MNYLIVATKQYEKSLKKLARSGKFDIDELNYVVNKLSYGGKLDAKYKDHQLVGNLKDFRECHVKPDLLLIYQKIEDKLVLVLVDIGSHSNLFD
jgi:mRNA interferase YafQ